MEASFKVFKTDNRPSSFICFFSPALDKFNSPKAFSACGVVFKSADKIAFNWVAACAAGVPVLDIAANAPPTSWNATPIFEATGRT